MAGHMQIHGHDIGVCSWSLQTADPAELTAKVRELGLAHVQLAMGGVGDEQVRETVRQLRAAGLFPDVAAPVVQRLNSENSAPARTTFAVPARGEIYFTTDGSDPRQAGTSAVSPKATRYAEAVTLRAPDILKARVRQGQTWSPLTEVTPP